MARDKVAIIGGGPAGLAALAHVSMQDIECCLYNRTPSRLQGIADHGGLDVHIDSHHFIPAPRIESDPALALRGSRVVLIALPAYAHIAAFELCAQYLEDTATVIFLSGSAASLEAANLPVYRDGLSERVLLGEMAVPPASARMIDEHSIRVLPHRAIRIAAFPSRRSNELLQAVAGLLDVTATPHVLDPAINNPNVLIHPAPMLTNYGAVERTAGEFSLINEGMTEGTLRLLDAVDREKMALQSALALEVFDVDHYYRSMGSDPAIYREPGENFGRNYRDRVWPRYLDEDVPFGTVLLSTLGELLGVPTPVSRAISVALAATSGVDYFAAGRSLARLGIAGMTKDELLSYLHEGCRSVTDPRNG